MELGIYLIVVKPLCPTGTLCLRQAERWEQGGWANSRAGRFPIVGLIANGAAGSP